MYVNSFVREEGLDAPDPSRNLFLSANNLFLSANLDDQFFERHSVHRNHSLKVKYLHATCPTLPLPLSPPARRSGASLPLLARAGPVVVRELRSLPQRLS